MHAKLPNEIKEQKKNFIKEINQNQLMSKKPKKVWTVLNYIEHSLILASRITGCVSRYTFASLFSNSIGITSSVVGLKSL